MSAWLPRIVILLLAIAAAPAIIEWIAALTGKIAQSLSSKTHQLVDPIFVTGSAGVEDVVRLGLYLIVIIGLIRFLFKFFKRK